MRRLAYVAVLLLTSLFAAAADTVIVRRVNVSPSNTYTINGSGFSPKGAAPVVTINGLSLTIESFTDTRIVGTLATSPAGELTLKVTNSQGHSTTFDPQGSNAEACQIKEVTPGTTVPRLPSYCIEQ
jgi:hypothetical protein